MLVGIATHIKHVLAGKFGSAVLVSAPFLLYVSGSSPVTLFSFIPFFPYLFFFYICSIILVLNGGLVIPLISSVVQVMRFSPLCSRFEPGYALSFYTFLNFFLIFSRVGVSDS